jgi:hypothetical protein
VQLVQPDWLVKSPGGQFSKIFSSPPRAGRAFARSTGGVGWQNAIRPRFSMWTGCCHPTGGSREAVEHLPITHRVDGDIEGSNETPVGALLPQGPPDRLTVSTLQIRMEYWHPTTG